MAKGRSKSAGSGKADVAMRRAPAQRRSRERVERILSAATALIAAHGSDQLRMSDVAERAGISIGSLYQYFPDKGAVICTLAERYNTAGRACIEAAFAEVRDLAGLGIAFARLIDQYYAMFLAEPAMRDIWSGMQADPQLAALELAESRTLGNMLAAVMKRVRPRAKPTELRTTAFLVMHLGEAAMRLAIALGRSEGDAIVAAYKRMAVRAIAGR